MQVTPGCPGTNASYTWLSWDRCKLHLTLLQSTAASVSHFPAHPLFSGSRETDEAFGVMKKPNFCFTSSSLAQVIDLCQQSTVSPAGAEPVVGASKARLQQQTSWQVCERVCVLMCNFEHCFIIRCPFKIIAMGLCFIIVTLFIILQVPVF